jgi:nicotinamide mononucleotide transporter
MHELGNTLQAQWFALSKPELIAVVLAILYLLLAIRQNILCWACAAVSSAIYVWLFIGAKLYMESLLYLFYVAMAFYGWHAWARGADCSAELPVTRWRWRVHAIALSIIALATAVAGHALAVQTDAAYPYIDTLTTLAAVWATFLVTRKVFENWWYWLAIDAASILIYWSRGLQLTSLLFVAYVLLIPFGMLQWHRSYHQRHAIPA